MVDTKVDLKQSKSLLPPQLTFPLPEDIVDALILTQEVAIHCREDNDADETNRDYALLAALIELKELRAEKDNVLDDQAKDDLLLLYRDIDIANDEKRDFFWSVLECAGCSEEFERYEESQRC